MFWVAVFASGTPGLVSEASFGSREGESKKLDTDTVIGEMAALVAATHEVVKCWGDRHSECESYDDSGSPLSKSLFYGTIHNRYHFIYALTIGYDLIHLD
jgi:hypothetical protein